MLVPFRTPRRVNVAMTGPAPEVLLRRGRGPDGTDQSYLIHIDRGKFDDHFQ
jgi:hypothetical protein